MTAPDTIIIAGGGIGGLTAALALAARGFRVTVLEQSAWLSEIGAGIQLSPNASRILLALGLGERLRPVVVAPESLVVRSASGRPIVTMPLAQMAREQFGAPYWVVHRADLHAVLVRAAEANPQIGIRCSHRVEDFAIHPTGVTVRARHGVDVVEQSGNALIGADGLRSGLRSRLDDRVQPRFRQRTAWRALVPAGALAPDLRRPVVQLWLGRDGHLVLYPVSGGAAVNLVAIVRDTSERPGWNAGGSRADLLARFPSGIWSDEAQSALAVPREWQTWSLYDLAPLRRWGEGPVTLLGDAAHAMLPFLAQGAGMAIEDAAVLADCLAQSPEDVPAALRRYEAARQPRAGAVQRAARGNDRIYHQGGAGAMLRNAGMRLFGGRRLLSRYAWVYGWRAPGTPVMAEREAAVAPRAGTG